MTDKRDLSRDAQRYLDGEPHGELSDAERAEADRLRRMATLMRGRLAAPNAAFTGRVMAAVRREPPPRRTALTWALEPGVRVPRWAIPLAAAALVLVWIAGARSGATRAGIAPVASVTSERDTVYVRFELTAAQAQTVHVAGDFSGWQPVLPLTRGADGVWVATVPIAVGVHHYQFVVDGSWIPDPRAGTVGDGFGGRNSVVVVGPKGVVRS